MQRRAPESYAENGPVGAALGTLVGAALGLGVGWYLVSSCVAVHEQTPSLRCQVFGAHPYLGTAALGLIGAGAGFAVGAVVGIV